MSILSGFRERTGRLKSKKKNKRRRKSKRGKKSKKR